MDGKSITDGLMNENLGQTKGKKVRESNFELLRLFCMLLILSFHFCSHGLKKGPFYGTSPILCQEIFWAIGAVAVICFILISGYFSIKAQWKGFVHLYVMCAFYAFMLNGLSCLANNEFSFKIMAGALLPFSHSQGLWFIECYFYLFLLSPFLNILAENCTKKKFVLLLFTLGLLNCYFGFLWGREFNPTGFDTMTFVFVYMIGRYIAIYTPRSTTSKTRFISFSVYIICGMIIFGLLEFVLYFDKLEFCKKIVAYHNPLMIIQAIAIFFFFRSFTFQNKVINWTASSVLAAYLITDNTHFKPLFWDFLTNRIESVSDDLLGITIFVVSLFVLIICILVDKIRLFITKPIELILTKINVYKLIERGISKIIKMI